MAQITAFSVLPLKVAIFSNQTTCFLLLIMFRYLLVVLPLVVWNLQGRRCMALSNKNAVSRREAMLSAGISVMIAPSIAQAAAASSGDLTGKQAPKRQSLSNDQLAEVIRNDVEVNQFMVSADITRDVYDESATFTDEIDTYQMDQWIKGTKRLFVAEKSHVDLVPNSIKVSDVEASFRFTETLLFNIPILKPLVYLSGTVVFTRDPQTGLITSYREQWDQDVNTVLKKANLFSG